MALENKATPPICWAEYATRPEARTFAAFKWDEATGERVPSLDPKTKVQLRDRRPLQSHRGNNLTGVTVATDVVSTIKMLRRDGWLVDIKINNGPAHEVDDSDRYAGYVKGKWKALGGIPEGECPAAMVVAGAIEAHLVIADAAKDGQPCPRSSLGRFRPPCRHFWAELHARRAESQAKHDSRQESALSEADRVAASNANSMAAMARATADVLTRTTETQAQLASIIAVSRQPEKPERGGK